MLYRSRVSNPLKFSLVMHNTWSLKPPHHKFLVHLLPQVHILGCIILPSAPLFDAVLRQSVVFVVRKSTAFTITSRIKRHGLPRENNKTYQPLLRMMPSRDRSKRVHVRVGEKLLVRFYRSNKSLEKLFKTSVIAVRGCKGGH